MANEFVIKNGFISKGNSLVEGSLAVIGNLNLTGNTNQIGNVNLTGNTTQYGNVYISGTSVLGLCALEVDGNVCFDGGLNLSGNTNQIGNFNITGNTTQIGNYHITGNTSQEGIYYHSGNTFVTGDTTQIGNYYLTGNTSQVGDFYLTGNTIIQSGITAATYNISSVPVENNTLFQILGRNETTGEVEYRQVNTIGNNVTILTGGTYSAQTTIDNVIGVDTSLTTTTIYLPDSVTSGRLRFEIKDIGLNAYNNPITIIAAGTDTIISYTNSQTLIMESEGGAIILFNTGLGQWWQM
jgi:hypothetical protein